MCTDIFSANDFTLNFKVTFTSNIKTGTSKCLIIVNDNLLLLILNHSSSVSILYSNQ